MGARARLTLKEDSFRFDASRHSTRSPGAAGMGREVYRWVEPKGLARRRSVPECPTIAAERANVRRSRVPMEPSGIGVSPRTRYTRMSCGCWFSTVRRTPLGVGTSEKGTLAPSWEDIHAPRGRITSTRNAAGERGAREWACVIYPPGPASPRDVVPRRRVRVAHGRREAFPGRDPSVSTKETVSAAPKTPVTVGAQLQRLRR